MVNRLIFAIALLPILAGCATSSRTLTGSPRAPLSPTDVRVYTQAPQSFEEIAVLGASRRSVTTAGGLRAVEKMIETMKSQAAEVGANGLLLEELADSNAVALGTGVGSQTYAQCLHRPWRRRFLGSGQKNSESQGDFRRRPAGPGMSGRKPRTSQLRMTQGGGVPSRHRGAPSLCGVAPSLSS